MPILHLPGDNLTITQRAFAKYYLKLIEAIGVVTWPPPDVNGGITGIVAPAPDEYGTESAILIGGRLGPGDSVEIISHCLALCPVLWLLDV